MNKEKSGLKKAAKPEILRKNIHNFLRIVRRVRGYFPLTWSGFVLICLTYVVWYGEVTKHSNQILYSAVLLFLMTMGIVFVFELIGFVIVLLCTRHANVADNIFDDLETTQRIDTRYRVYRPFYLPFVQVAVSLTTGPYTSRYVSKGAWIHEKGTLETRGKYEKVEHDVTVRDIFGLFSMTFPHQTSFVASIKPAECRFESFQVSAKTSGEGYSYPTGEAKGEMVEMRRYQAGDPLRYVLWRVFARSRKLLVRAPEPAIVDEQEMFVYFVAGEKDDSLASLTRTFISKLEKTDSDFYFCADGADHVSRNSKDAISDVVDSVEYREEGGRSLDSLMKNIPQKTLGRCFMMVPPEPGEWLEYVKSFCAKTGTRPTFVVAVEPEDRLEKQPSRFNRWFFDKKQVDSKTIVKRQEVCEKLLNLGNVNLIDITTGAVQDYTPTLRSSRSRTQKALSSGDEA